MPCLNPRNTTAAGITEICRRLAALLNCLALDINAAVAEGEIVKDLQRFRNTMLTKLESEGWSFSYDGGPKLKVRQPGHRHPFPPRTRSGKGTQGEH